MLKDTILVNKPVSNFKPIVGICGGFHSLISDDKKWIIHCDGTIEVNTINSAT